MIQKNKILFAVMGAVFFITPLVFVSADIIDDLKAKITEREEAIKKLELEIASTQKQIDDSRSTQTTLKGAIQTFDAERRKFLAQINVAEQKIGAKELEIESLGFDIEDKNKSIRKSLDGLNQTIRAIDSLESKTDIVAMLNYERMSDYWDAVKENEIVSGALSENVGSLKTLREDLEKDKGAAEAKRRELESLKKELSARKKVAEAAKAEQEKLLKQTKNKESEYQKLLKDQFAKRDAFEKEMLDFESQLKFEIDPTSLPKTGSGVLNWPLSIAIKITQYFGNTDFANKNPQLYNGMGHNGIDFRAPIGTSIKSSLGGKVVGTGDTDIICPGASYGKWVLVEHGNGLSTLYAHLSAIGVSTGNIVSTGETLGLSGNTGYSTGPHLHFTVYATQGVKIMSRKSKVCNGTYTMPVADLRAYLNPLSYL